MNSEDLTSLQVNNFSHSSAIHMRLGDLLEIEEKNPTNFEDVKNVIRKNLPIFQGSPLFIYSDSPEKAIDLLGEIRFAVLAEHILQKSVLKTILAMTESSIFVGTGSKLSIWVAILRVHVFPTRKTFLPSYLQPILEDLVGNLDKFPEIQFYQSDDVKSH
jgi:hypothetical protein